MMAGAAGEFCTCSSGQGDLTATDSSDFIIVKSGGGGFGGEAYVMWLHGSVF